MDLSKRKYIELNQKLNSLTEEFSHWRNISRAGESMEKHHTQIRRVTCELSHLQAKIQEILDGVKGSPEDILTQCRGIEDMIQELHRIWEYFRGKLLQRHSEWFGKYLITSDEYAWACYQPARDNVIPSHIPPEDIKEPPLVFFNGNSSPLIVPRGSSFQGEVEQDHLLETEDFKKAVESLPISVISIPWFQVQHLPDALVIGHEAGHAVEFDLKLSSRIRTIINDAMASEDVPLSHRDAWNSWQSELFADLWGTLCAGPAFTGCLIDFLAMDKDFIQEQKKTFHKWGDYPTIYMRVLLSLKTLELMNFADKSEELQQQWTQTFPNHAMADWEEDIPVIIKALMTQPFPELQDKTVPEIISFSRAQHKLACENAELAIQGFLLKDSDQRSLIAASRIVFEQKPESGALKKIQNRIIKKVLEVRTQGVRGTEKQDTENLAAKKDKTDQRAAEAIFELFLKTGR